MMKTGIDIISKLLETCTGVSGVYQFINKRKEVIYIGKAKNLRKRLSSYLKPDRPKTEIIVTNIDDIVVYHTENEYEALILEAKLIKRIRPKYNILLKDDKSFSYIVVDESHLFPRVIKYRGTDLQNKIFYGPFPYAMELNKAMQILQKLFLLRSCSDKFFQGRNKPCMLYQIKQCSAPCVGEISADKYQALVNQVKDFLDGNSSELYKTLFVEMNKSSKRQEYEIAAKYRDRIQVLSKFVTKNTEFAKNINDTDVICLTACMEKVLIQVSFIRLGAVIGHKVITVDSLDEGLDEILQLFISRFYLSHFVPKTIVIESLLSDSQIKFLEGVLKKVHNKNVQIIKNLIGSQKKILAHCMSVLDNTRIHAVEDRTPRL